MYVLGNRITDRVLFITIDKNKSLEKPITFTTGVFEVSSET